IYKELVGYRKKLENHFRDMQDIEFTVEKGKLYILQARNGKRAGAAAIKIALDMVKEGFIDKKTAIARVTPGHLDQLLHPMIDPATKKQSKPLTKGLNASPGAAAGRIVFTAKDAEDWHARGEKVLLVRKETSPEDIGGMVVAQGILTSTGGMTSHAAVVARGMGTPCIAGASEVSVQSGKIVINGREFAEGAWLTIDGSGGQVYEGTLPLVEPKISRDMEAFLAWCDEVRAKAVRGKLKGFGIRTNADTPKDAKRAFDFGAEGIGLCRTEHMFFEEKLPLFRAMIVADTEKERRARLADLLPLQQKDFFGIFQAMEGRPVTIRLLDPPLHEFVPHTDGEIEELAQRMGADPQRLKIKVASLKEANPMLGHRGCRLAITYPEIYDMQVEAIARAAVDCVKQGIPVKPEIMIPLIFSDRELDILRPNAEKVLKKVFAETGVASLPVKIGTMIEIPRAALRAGEIALKADFFSFGTNDLTQMSFGISRDDIGTFLPDYLGKGVFDVDPFSSIDEAGVGLLVQLGVSLGRDVAPNLSVGVCGEHGGDPASIDFFYRAGLSYVSCSPFRVPLARLASAQAVLNNPEEWDEGPAKKPAKKAAAKKAAAEKAPAKKPGTKAAAAKTKAAPAKKPAPAKKAVAEKAPAKKPGPKAVAAKKAAKPVAEKKKPVPAKKAAAEKAPTKKPGPKAVAAKKAAKPVAEKKKPATGKPGGK
ncbi:MAG: pyruvate, phosphate dikinase, partial [Treponema sp.]|nr:pyruvate, phosphate dikinase [Treponema sp.]